LTGHVPASPWLEDGVRLYDSFLFDGRRWTRYESDRLPTMADPWLMLDFHNSDMAAVSYRPVGPGVGTAYLGYTPRTYFNDPLLSPPTDVAREAAGLAAWWASRQGLTNHVDRDAKRAVLAGMLAEDLDGADLDPHPGDADDVDNAVFTDIAVRFLAALDLPPLAELRLGDDGRSDEG
jgi:hypothetical protein